MNPNRTFYGWWVLLGGLIISMACAGAVLAGRAALIMSQTLSEVVTRSPVSKDALPLQPARLTPTAALQTESLPGIEMSLSDDFSSSASPWPQQNDGRTIAQYEDGAYSLQVAEADFYDWVVLPLPFQPLEVWFDIKGLDGPQNGTFGVFCQMQDADNNYYVEFDLATRSYVIGKTVERCNIPLTPTNADYLNWVETRTLKAAPTQVNRIGVKCHLDFIALIINHEWVTRVPIRKPFEYTGEMAFFVYAFAFADENGYKVFFDNVEVYGSAP